VEYSEEYSTAPIALLFASACSDTKN
jgi:hypothetical protein